MNTMSRERMVAVAGILVLILPAVWQLFSPVRLALPTVSMATAPQAGSNENASALVVPNQESFAEIEQRPLFVPTRRPPPPATIAVAAPAPKVLDKYTVIGIVAASNRAVAILRGQTGAPVHLRLGQPLEGWTLETIEPNKLTFVSGDQRQELELKTNKGRQDQNDPRMNKGMFPQPPASLPGIGGLPPR